MQALASDKAAPSACGVAVAVTVTVFVFVFHLVTTFGGAVFVTVTV
jgi:hypothetical protein